MSAARSESNRDYPFFAHFPEIKTHLLKQAIGRLQGNLLKYAKNDRLFQNWSTKMRYAPTDEVKREWTTEWKRQAETLVNEMAY